MVLEHISEFRPLSQPLTFIDSNQKLSIVCECVAMKGIDWEAGRSPVQMGCAAIVPKIWNVNQIVNKLDAYLLSVNVLLWRDWLGGCKWVVQPLYPGDLPLVKPGDRLSRQTNILKWYFCAKSVAGFSRYKIAAGYRSLDEQPALLSTNAAEDGETGIG